MNDYIFTPAGIMYDPAATGAPSDAVEEIIVVVVALASVGGLTP